MAAFLKQANDKEIPEFHNNDEVFEFERDCVEYTIGAVYKYMYQSLYSSVFPPYIYKALPKVIKTVRRNSHAENCNM